MKTLLLWGLMIASSASAQETPPATQPNWSEVRRQAEEQMKSRLFDPQSAQITYTSGFQWGWMKPLIGKRQWGWVACGTLNAKNRLGGYVGRKAFAIASWPDGHVSYNDVVDVSCYGSPSALQRELMDGDGGAAGGLADQLTKMADLRDRGVLTPAEFEAQKARLLAR